MDGSGLSEGDDEADAAVERPSPQRRVMTSPMLKAMSHPLRRRIIALLGAQDHGRASDLATQLGVAANKVSFHLRTLADAGMVEEAPEFARDRRDRVWKAVNESYKVGSPQEPVSSVDEAPLVAYLSQMELDQRDMVARVIAWAPQFATGRESDAKAELSTGTLRLTAEEADVVFEEVLEVLERARRRHQDTPTGQAHVWDYTFMAARDDL